jgi:hypothetical protein
VLINVTCLLSSDYDHQQRLTLGLGRTQSFEKRARKSDHAPRGVSSSLRATTVTDGVTVVVNVALVVVVGVGCQAFSEARSKRRLESRNAAHCGFSKPPRKTVSMDETSVIGLIKPTSLLILAIRADERQNVCNERTEDYISGKKTWSGRQWRR